MVQGGPDKFTQVDDEALRNFDELDARLQLIYVAAYQKVIDMEDTVTKKMEGAQRVFLTERETGNQR